MIEQTGLTIIKLLGKNEEIYHEKEVTVSHILIANEDSNISTEVTRTKEESLTLIEDLHQQLKDGANFAELAATYSDDATTKEAGGLLPTPVSDDGTYVYDFQQAALELEMVGAISEIVETQFGYHLIIANGIGLNITEMKYHYEDLTFSTANDNPWEETELKGNDILDVTSGSDETIGNFVYIKFNENGTKILEEITSENIGNQLGIFVEDKLISAPTVQATISDGVILINGSFSENEAIDLAKNIASKQSTYRYNANGNISRKEVAETIYRLLISEEVVEDAVE